MARYRYSSLVLMGSVVLAADGMCPATSEYRLHACIQYCVQMWHEADLLWMGFYPSDQNRSLVKDIQPHKILQCLQGCMDGNAVDEVPVPSHPSLLAFCATRTECTLQQLDFDTSELTNFRAVASAAQVLLLCGVIYIRGALPRELAGNVASVARDFMRDSGSTKFREALNAYEGKDGLSERGALTKNLRGGRFQFPMPPDPALRESLGVLSNRSVAQIMANIWKAQPQLFIAQFMGQLLKTQNQSFHLDSNTIEEVKVQVALKDYAEGDGPPEFVIGSHLGIFYEVIHEKFPHQFATVCKTPVQQGDAILYFPAVRHRGLARTTPAGWSDIPTRPSLDLTLHSASDFYNAGHREEPSYKNVVQAYRTQIETCRRAWEIR